MMAIEHRCTALWLTASRKCHYGRVRDGHLAELASGKKFEPIHVMKHFSPPVELMRQVARQLEWELSGMGADRYIKNLLRRAVRRLPEALPGAREEDEGWRYDIALQGGIARFS